MGRRAIAVFLFWAASSFAYLGLNIAPPTIKMDMLAYLGPLEAHWFSCSTTMNTGGAALERVGCGRIWLYEREYLYDRSRALVWFGPFIWISLLAGGTIVGALVGHLASRAKSCR